MSNRIDEALRLWKEAEPDPVLQDELRRRTDDALARMRQALKQLEKPPLHHRARVWFGARLGRKAPAEGIYRLRREEGGDGFILEPLDVTP